MYKIFVDGHEGTTGLRINEMLVKRKDIELLIIEHEKRKDPFERAKLMNEADVVFLCLPDDAAKEAVSLVKNKKTKIIDASTAHRVNKEWVYGLPELSKDQRNKIKNSNRVSVPGCHATGFILSIYPLIKENIIPLDYPIVCYSLTGYSGGGKKLIKKYESKDSHKYDIFAPRHYALNLKHKHLPEMTQITGLIYPPLFSPIVGNFYNGMAVSIPLTNRLFNKKITIKDINEIFHSYYENEYFINVVPLESNEELLEDGFLNPTVCNNTNMLEIFTFGTNEHTLIISRFDNLGKGASGAAIQNMNIMLDIDETTGLI